MTFSWMKHNQPFALTWLVVALAFVSGTSACGGDDDGGTADGGTSTTDGGTSTTDGGTSATDGGTSTTDGGTSTTDGGTSTTDGGSECACIGQTLEYGNTGGHVISSRTSSIDPCRTYELVETPSRDGSSTTCTNDVPCEGGGVKIADVIGALANADVVAAFAAAPITYGVDSRPVDGSIFSVTQGAQEFLVGSPCGSGGGIGGVCTPIPPGVQALVDLLRTLDTERLAEEDCATVFP